MNDYWTDNGKQKMHACFCIGPQNGHPVCPCRMRTMKVVDGRYVEVIDHGPVTRGWEGKIQRALRNFVSKRNEMG